MNITKNESVCCNSPQPGRFGDDASMSANTEDPESLARRLHVGLEFDMKMLVNIRATIEEHEATCSRPPKAILLNPANHELLGWDEFLGLPVLPSPKAEPERARLVCGTGRAGYCEQGEVVWDEEGNAYVFIPDEGEDDPS